MTYNKKVDNVRNGIKRDAKHLDWLTIVRMLLLCFIIFLAFLKFIARPIYVDGSSMYPTLKDKDIGISNVLMNYISGASRFDVVMAYDETQETSVVKRVIGLPGETIQYRDEILYVNNQPVFEHFIDEEYKEKQTNKGEVKFTDDYGPIKLKDGEYFLVGDNRRVSRDSRTIGPFKSKNIISKDIFVAYPW